ncbi:MAG: hypothetical protein ACOX47_04470 [Bacillota bacterium]
MKYYRLFSFYLLVSLLALFSWQFAKWEPGKSELSVSVSKQEMIVENYQAPINLVFHFYQAIENNDWEQVKTLVTPVWWGEMHRSGYRQKWQKMIEDDPSIDFVMFLVTSQNVDLENNFAWVMGKVDWASKKQEMDDENETVFFIKQDNEWKISSIRLNIPVEVVEDFYQSINAGKFRELPDYFTKEYGEMLNRGEVIKSLRADWQKNQSGVYCVFYLHDFGISRNKAWVKGDVLWNPLTSRVKETPTTVFLTNINNGWKIEKITGHWEGEK